MSATEKAMDNAINPRVYTGHSRRYYNLNKHLIYLEPTGGIEPPTY
jgi:hypothetical protein